MGAAIVTSVGATQTTSASDSGFGTGGYGEGAYGHVTDNPDDGSITVQTRDAAVKDETVVLHGEVTELEGYEEVSVGFEWGEKGTGLTESTTTEFITSPGSFSAEIQPEPQSTYEFRAIGTAGDVTATGSTNTFETLDEDDDQSEADNEETDNWSSGSDEGDEDLTAAPVVHTLQAVDLRNSKDPHVEACVVWHASIDEGRLTYAELTITGPDGVEVTHEYKIDTEATAHSEIDRITVDPSWDDPVEFDVTLTVTSGHHTETIATTTFESV